MQPANLSLLRPFGEPLDLELLLEFAEIDEDDVPDAMQWFDENASPQFVGCLDNPPLNKVKKR